MSWFAVRDEDGKYWDFEGMDDYRKPLSATNRGHKWAEEVKANTGGSEIIEVVEKPAPIVVSEEEAEMLEQAKCDDDPAELIVGFVNSHDKYDDDRKAEDRLMRAYVIGWVVEKTRWWYVKVPHTTNSYYYDMGWGSGLETQDMKSVTQPLPGFREAQFTQDEINKRGLQDCEKVEVTDDEE